MLNKAKINKNAAEALKKKKEQEIKPVMLTGSLTIDDGFLKAEAEIVEKLTIPSELLGLSDNGSVVTEIPKAKRGKNVKS